MSLYLPALLVAQVLLYPFLLGFFLHFTTCYATNKPKKKRLNIQKDLQIKCKTSERSLRILFFILSAAILAHGPSQAMQEKFRNCIIFSLCNAFAYKMHF